MAKSPVYYDKRYVMRLVDVRTGEMKCRICGATHFANRYEGGYFKKGSWQCPMGCKP